MNKKERCALKAIDYIKDDMIIGLGGGGTIKYLARLIKENKKNIKIVTPSYETMDYCYQLGLEVCNLMYVKSLDLAFDGCDECDEYLNALKSGGGIHTREKLIGTMAKEYILLVDESKVSKRITYKVPVVVEVFKEAYLYVVSQLEELNAQVSWRKASLKDGFVYSDQGHILLEAQFDSSWNPEILYSKLINIQGVIEVSLFVGVVNKILVVSDGGYRIIQ